MGLFTSEMSICSLHLLCTPSIDLLSASFSLSHTDSPASLPFEWKTNLSERLKSYYFTLKLPHSVSLGCTYCLVSVCLPAPVPCPDVFHPFPVTLASLCIKVCVPFTLYQFLQLYPNLREAAMCLRTAEEEKFLKWFGRQRNSLIGITSLCRHYCCRQATKMQRTFYCTLVFNMWVVWASDVLMLESSITSWDRISWVGSARWPLCRTGMEGPICGRSLRKGMRTVCIRRGTTP